MFLVLNEATIFEVVFRVTHIGQKEHHSNLGSEVLLRLHILDLILQSHWD